MERKRTSVLVDKIAVLCSHVSATCCMLLVLAEHLEGMLPVLDLYNIDLVYVELTDRSRSAIPRV